MKIVDLDGYAANPGDISWDGVKELGEFVFYDNSEKHQIIERAKDAEIVLVNKINMTREIIEQLPKLKYIGELATGYNNIDLQAAKDHGIIVTNIPAYSTDSVTQFVFAHLLNVATHADHYACETRKGVWSAKKSFCYWDEPLFELAGKTLGIVGLGNIGAKVAWVGHMLGMDISAYTSKNSSDLPEWIRKTTLEGLYHTADIITLHCPLTKENTHMINKDVLAQMRPGTILINTGRGALIDEEAVASALKKKHLKAYCADVMEQEPPHKDNPLLKLPNAYITPHIAWATLEARQRLMDICVENIKAFIEGNPQNVVNK
ncbi:D-2-hydroxyacid dehydrogenase [Prevotella falsenii]|uniref:D-2-hydroxyacid dehydrogenase n=1 Tax=Prevotella falsenii TaxID=515414 RepID=UPI0004698B57|nr:D-2-hydroxyacid dehydrogenase [Prevotella falsenii]